MRDTFLVNAIADGFNAQTNYLLKLLIGILSGDPAAMREFDIQRGKFPVFPVSEDEA